MNFSQTIRVLLVEDEPGDAFLVKTQLKQIDSDHFEVTWAQSLLDAGRHLAAQAFNVILLDLSLPDSEGMATVSSTKALAGDTPIVILSGHGDTDFAVNALGAGAADYMVKGDFGYGGLGRVIRYALFRTEMEAHNKLLVAALDAAANGIVITDIDGRIEWANQAFTKVTGFSLAEAYSHNPRELVKSGHQDNAFYQSLWDTILANRVWQGELINRRKDGALYNEEMTITPLADQQGNISHFIAVKQEITARKLMEQTLRVSEEKFRSLYDSTTDAVMLLDDDGIFDCNAATLRIFGCDKIDYFSQKHLAELSPPAQPSGANSATLAKEQIATAKEKGSHLFEWFYSRANSGQIFPAEVLLNAMELNGQAIIQATVRDITERKQLESHNNLLIAALKAAANGIVITNTDTTIIWVNPSFGRLTGYSLEEAVGNKTGELNKSGLQNQSFYQDMWSKLLQGQNWSGELVNKRKDGSLYHAGLSVAPVIQGNGEISHFIGIQEDISARKELEAQLQKLATTDPLTGLYNRRIFLEQLDLEREKIRRLANYSVVLLMLDLDFFKRINDTFGHAAGDATLKTFADTVNTNLRAIDMAARLGGEEFAILLTGADKEDAHIMAERLRDQVQAIVIDHAFGPVRITVSIGATSILAADSDSEAPMHRADAALYEAKEKGRNQIRWSDC